MSENPEAARSAAEDRLQKEQARSEKTLARIASQKLPRLSFIFEPQLIMNIFFKRTCSYFSERCKRSHTLPLKPNLMASSAYKSQCRSLYYYYPHINKFFLWTQLYSLSLPFVSLPPWPILPPPPRTRNQATIMPRLDLSVAWSGRWDCMLLLPFCFI